MSCNQPRPDPGAGLAIYCSEHRTAGTTSSHACSKRDSGNTGSFSTARPGLLPFCHDTGAAPAKRSAAPDT